MLLIITNKDDLAADYLISALIEKSLPYFRINSEDIQNYLVNYSCINNQFEAEIKHENRIIDLSEVKSVWYRRAISPSVNQDIDFYSKKFISGELQHLVEGICLNDDLIWVNPFDAVIKAERKIYQLKVARDVGFKIPNSLISNDKNSINLFHLQNSPVICKPIYHGYFQNKDDNYAIYSNRIDPKMFDGLNSIYPTYFQNEIKKTADIRITVVGNDIFPVQITFDNSKTPDWRRKECEVTYNEFDLPNMLKENCIRLVSELGLNFGAIDMARTTDDEYYFFEINPTGEWAWIEHKLGLPIRESLIKTFYGIK
jgi:glutathione synthase/RimK-type ligase-like ATP-grasp enzyme